MPLFEACDLSIAYAGDGQAAPVRLESVSFGLDAGRVYDLTGPSGAGEVHSAAGLRPDDAH